MTAFQITLVGLVVRPGALEIELQSRHWAGSIDVGTASPELHVVCVGRRFIEGLKRAPRSEDAKVSKVWPGLALLWYQGGERNLKAPLHRALLPLRTVKFWIALARWTEYLTSVIPLRLQ